jgi:hypothetical protein
VRVSVTLQGIFRQGFERYARSRRLPLHIHQAARAIQQCRTAALGGHVSACPDGHTIRVHYNSCRHRACPQCAHIRSERWLEARARQLLPCDHYHAIFTVPHELEPLWQANRPRLGHFLFTAVRDTLLELLADPKYLGARPGVIATLHTWGRTLSFHPHVHCLVTGGGLTAGGWKSVRNGYLLPVRVVRALFRGKLLAALRQALAHGRLALPPDLSPTRCENLRRQLGRKTWNVRIQERYPHGRGVLVYLGRYLRGGPLGNRRLVSAHAERVVFRYTDHRDGRPKTLALPLEHFVQRITWHVPEPRRHVVRYWGLYARGQAAEREAARRQLGSRAPTAAPPPAAPRDERGCDVPHQALCPVCGQTLVRLAVWGRGREPPHGLLA